MKSARLLPTISPTNCRLIYTSMAVSTVCPASVKCVNGVFTIILSPVIIWWPSPLVTEQCLHYSTVFFNFLVAIPFWWRDLDYGRRERPAPMLVPAGRRRRLRQDGRRLWHVQQRVCWRWRTAKAWVGFTVLVFSKEFPKRWLSQTHSVYVSSSLLKSDGSSWKVTRRVYFYKLKDWQL